MIRTLTINMVTGLIILGLYSINALAQEENTAAPRDARSPVMLRQWTVTPSAINRENPVGPEQSGWIGSNGFKDNDDRVSPEQAEYGSNPHLQKGENAPDTTHSHLLTEADFSALKQTTTTLVNQVMDPLRIRLQDKKTIQLAGIDIPDFDAYESGEISMAAQEKLNKLLTNQQVRLYQTKNSHTGRSNRMGHLLSHVVRSQDNLWIQGALLVEGLARVRPTERNPEMGVAMMTLEEQARHNKRGLWKDDRRHYVLRPETAGKAINNWGIIKGKIKHVALVRNTLYLNFGDDWRSDFTISLNTKTRKALLKQGINPQTLGGKTVRVRGWVEEYNGPLIELIHPVWLEILSNDE